jgi:hypothetical protein
MGKSRELYEDIYCICIMPEGTHQEICGMYDIKLISVYDKNMYQHYKEDARWQEADLEYKLAKEKKQQIELEIIYQKKQKC